MMADVVRAAPNLPEPLVVWAQALEKVGYSDEAIDRLRTAASLSHGDVNVLMYLANLLQARGNLAETRQILEQLSQKPSLSASGRVQVARMYSMQGQYDDAIAVLRGGNMLDGADPDRDLLLAQLLQAQGKSDDAAHIYDLVLQSPAVNDSAIRAIAWFYAGRQDMVKAQQAIDKLNALQLPPGVKELTLAAFAEQFNPKLDAALSQYHAATLAAPSTPMTWKGVSGFHLRHRAYDAAIAAAEQGLKINAGDPQLAALVAGAKTLAGIKGGNGLQSLINAFAANPADPAAQQTIDALATSETKRETAEQSLPRLRDVADLYPKFLPVQMLLAERYFAAGQFDQADAIATRAMQAMPTEADPAHVLAVIAAAAGHWDRALAAATEWRTRSLEQPIYADEQIAEAKLHLNDPAGALQQITPYLPRVTANPDGSPQIVRQQAQALAQQGHADEAQAVLDPLVKKSAQWRSVWLDVATATANDAVTAATWIEKITPLVDLNSPAEKTRLATAWYNAGQRFHDDAALTKARDLLKPLVDTGDPTANICFLYGSVAQQLNDLPAAEAAYRKALQIDQNQSMARNNLAYTLLRRGGDLQEAKSLAERAVADVPSSSAYQDTLARIYARMGNLDAALTTFQNAVRADGGNVEALIGLADAQSRSGSREKAVGTLERVDAILRNNPTVPDAVRQQLEDVRTSLKKPGESTSADVK
jgi:tetratricopeptide (TPR) repeat protein